MSRDMKLASNSTSCSAVGVQPVVRKPDFEFPEHIPADWYDGKLHLSNYFDAVSIGATPFEGFFIRAVRHVLDSETLNRPENAQLLEEAKTFAAQEMQHTIAHGRYNKMLAKRGYPVKEITRWCVDYINKTMEGKTDREVFAMAVAGESFLGDVGDVLLSTTDYTDKMHPAVRRLFKWHFYEEIEHRAISFDMYKALYGRGLGAYATLIKMYLKTTVSSTVLITVPFGKLLKHNEITGFKAWMEILNFLLINPGINRQMLKGYFRFFSPRYHPWKYRDNVETLRRLKEEIVTDEWAQDFEKTEREFQTTYHAYESEFVGQTRHTEAESQTADFDALSAA